MLAAPSCVLLGYWLASDETARVRVGSQPAVETRPAGIQAAAGGGGCTLGSPANTRCARPAGCGVVSGVQSLISVYLVALWALSYFGRPFE